MPETEKSKGVFLHREQPRVRTTYPGWAILMGIAVALAGIGMLAAARWASEVSNRPVLALVGANFIIVGCAVAVMASKGMRMRTRAKAFGGRQPWRYDHPWNSRGIDDGSGKRVINSAMAVGSIAFFLVPFHLLIYDDPPADGAFILYAAIGLMDIIVLISFCHVTYLLLRRIRFGPTRLIFGQFPCFTGQTLHVTFAGGRLFARCEKMKAELHCIKEYYEWSGPATEQTARHVNESIYRDSLLFSTDASGNAEISFAIPFEAVSTDLVGDPQSQPPHYWELVVTADRTGMNYEGIFLVPVYRPE